MKSFNLNNTFLFAALLLATEGVAQTNLIATIHNKASTNNFLATESFRGIEVDKTGRIWVGTAASGSTGYGVYFYSDSSWNYMPSTADQQVRTVISDNKGIWIGMGKTGVQANTGGVWNYASPSTWIKWNSSTIYPYNGLPSRYIYGLAYDPKLNTIWSANGQTVSGSIIQEGGIAYLKNQIGSFFKISNGLPASDIRVLSICVGANEVLAGVDRSCISGNCTVTKIARYSLTGLYLGDLTTTIPFTNAAGGPTPRAIFVDSKERIWVGLNNAVAVKDNTGWHYLTSAEIPFPPAGNFVNFDAIREDKNGDIWIGTTGGLIHFTGDGPTNTANWTNHTINNLSLSVTGITFDRSGNMWLATSTGVAVVTLDSKFKVYTISTQKKIQVALSRAKHLLIAADGDDRSTLFSYKTTNSNISFRLPSLNENYFGAIGIIKRNNDSCWFFYKHPIDQPFSFSRENVIEAYDINTGQKVDSIKFEICRPPVIMLHGLWSYGKIYEPFKQMILNSGDYKAFQLANPDYPSDVYFSENRGKIPENIHSLFLKGLDNNFSFGKVDLIGHSMGGVLSRLYLQSWEYKSDINKLIALNTPHSGSPMPNLVKKYSSLQFLLYKVGRNPYRGAINNLRLDNPAIDEDLNGQLRINLNIVPSHVIVTNETININPPLLMPLYVKIIATFLNVTLNTTLDVLFNSDSNDLIVGELSQSAGLSGNHKTKILGQWHGGSTENNTVMAKVYNLLRASKKDPQFSNSGFTPPNLDPNPLFSRTNTINKTNATVSITQPAAGMSVTPGQSINVNVTGSGTISKLLFVAGNSTIEPYVKDTASNNGIFNYNVPTTAIGRIDFAVLGVDANGDEVIDSSYIVVNPTGSITSIVTNPNFIEVPKNDSLLFNVMATYSDGVVRDITGDTTISYQLTDATLGTVDKFQSKVFGNKVGETLLNITYKGVTASTFLNVTDSTNSIQFDSSIQPKVYLNGFKLDSALVNVCFNSSKQSCFNTFSKISSIQYSISMPSTKGSVSIPTSSVGLCINYTPNANTTGIDSCKISLCDSLGNCKIFPIKFNVINQFSGFSIIKKDDTLITSVFGQKYIWYRNNILHPNDSLQSIVTSISGVYKVSVVNYDGCEGLSDSLIIGAIPCAINYWNGAVSDVWENPANWSCGSVPGDNTVVYINSSKPNFPKVRSMAVCKSIYIDTAASINITTGFRLDVMQQ